MRVLIILSVLALVSSAYAASSSTQFRRAFIKNLKDSKLELLNENDVFFPQPRDHFSRKNKLFWPQVRKFVTFS